MNFVFSNRAKTFSIILMVIGLAAIVGGFFADHSDHHGRWWSNLLINGFYFTAISLGALFFYALHFATETAWAVILRRVIESVFSFIPIGASCTSDCFHWCNNALESYLPLDGRSGSRRIC